MFKIKNNIKNRIRDQCKKDYIQIKLHWLHAILGFTSLFEGVILLVNDGYFVYPPYLRQEMNNDLIGLVAVIIGFKLIRWCANEERTSKQDRNLLMASSGFFAFISVAELIQVFAPNCSPHVLSSAIANFALLFISFFLSGIGGKK